MMSPDEILRFWLDEVGPEGWFRKSDAFDAEIRDRFEQAWQSAREGAYSLWLTYPTGALAYIILTDQFPRNMFRGTAKSYSTDGAALAAAKSAIERNWDMRIDEPARKMFYMPLMHSENLCDQDRCVRLVCERLSDAGNATLLHARAHRAVIRLFGRFPFRNAALSRSDTAPEAAFTAGGGYGATVRSLQTSQAA
ncbi:DUF924 family protein [Roseobacter ponti]|uniref:DUF924 domain-containing protein n=1 Tax=Roseobacter ponti TaxID=1891787 RepID=A0A858SVG4_9RHOB|nr:DUF924 family protein [Roseobacter ponti]QJF51481.1 DUF924 domain-containing protein [Roseobacter ponti]